LDRSGKHTHSVGRASIHLDGKAVRGGEREKEQSKQPPVYGDDSRPCRLVRKKRVVISGDNNYMILDAKLPLIELHRLS